MGYDPNEWEDVEYVPQQLQQAPINYGFANWVNDRSRALLEGVTLGGASETLGHLDAAIGKDYDKRRAAEEQDRLRFEKSNPYTSNSLEFTGSLGTGLGLAAALPLSATASLPTALLYGAGMGATQGAIQGYNKGDGLTPKGRWEEAEKGGMLGAGLGLAFGAGGELVKKGAKKIGELGDNYLYDSLGVTKGNRAKGLKFKQTETLPDGSQVITGKMERSLGQLKKDGFFKGNSSDPTVLNQKLYSKIDELSNSLDSEAGSVNSALAGTKANSIGSEKVYDWIEKSFVGTEKKRLLRELGQIDAEYAATPRTFQDLLALRRKLSNSWKDGSSSQKEMGRKLYSTINEELDDLAKRSGNETWRQSNNELSNYLSLKGPLTNALAKGNSMGQVANRAFGLKNLIGGSLLGTAGTVGIVSPLAATLIGGAKLAADINPVAAGRLLNATSSGMLSNVGQSVSRGLQTAGTAEIGSRYNYNPSEWEDVEYTGGGYQNLAAPMQELPEYNDGIPTINIDQRPEPISYGPVIGSDRLNRLALAVRGVESNNNPRAVSNKGAQGSMQIMPAMQKAYGVTDPFDPEQSFNAGRSILADELKRFKDEKLALAAYNAGSPRVLRAIKRAGSTEWEDVKKYLPKETQAYVPKIYKKFA